MDDENIDTNTNEDMNMITQIIEDSKYDMINKQLIKACENGKINIIKYLIKYQKYNVII